MQCLQVATFSQTRARTPAAMRKPALLLVGALGMLVWTSSTAAATESLLPRSYYRFEDASDLMKDSAPAALHLVATGEAVPEPKTQAEGGQVGGWMQLDGCGSGWNRSLWANASQLPRQCTASAAARYCNPNFACAAMPGGKKGGCCCNNTADPAGKTWVEEFGCRMCPAF